MDITPQLKALAEKVSTVKEQIGTEEATKNAFVLPFIHLLGYDIFNPLEVVPEFTADLGLKKGEKVDFAIFQSGDPILIIECKHWKEKLDVHGSQLFRYFHVTKTRFSLLTNGVEYRFYTDLEETNKMDEKPFLEFDITKIRDVIIGEVAKFHKSNFDVDKILNNASLLKHLKGIRSTIESEIANPSPDFVRLLASPNYSGRITAQVLEQFTELVKRPFSQMISEKVSERLTNALNKETSSSETPPAEVEEESKVVTTEEEMEGFRIVQAILRRKVSKERIVARDTQSYFGVLLDDNNRKPLCRLRFNGSKKYLGIIDKDKNETKILLGSIDDIYVHEKELLATVEYYNEE
ncbi:MAG: restriction endonuclease [Algoriphagus sp.]|nr:restriction endonuclease [Algoriphagus sp.]